MFHTIIFAHLALVAATLANSAPDPVGTTTCHSGPGICYCNPNQKPPLMCV
jgi:hypothetical protein